MGLWLVLRQLDRSVGSLPVTGSRASPSLKAAPSGMVNAAADASVDASKTAAALGRRCIARRVDCLENKRYKERTKE